MQPWVYIVLLGLVLLIYARLMPKKEAKPSANWTKELEETMEHFASDMEEQNEALVRLFTDTKKDYEMHLAKLSGRMEALEKQNFILSQEINRLQQLQSMQHIHAAQAEAQRQSPSPSAASEAMQTKPAENAEQAKEPVPAAPSLMNIKERYPDLFQLYEQGKSTEAIAKKLGMNKGEVSLILQLSKQEEKARV
jgi:TolA-binding protein